MNIRDVIIVGAVVGVVMILSMFIHIYMQSSEECLTTLVSHTEVVDPTNLTMFEELELRADGLYYKIFSNPISTPYTGTVNIKVEDGILVEFHQSN